PFACIVVLAMAGLIAGIYRMRIRQLGLRQKKLEELVVERTSELSESEKKFRQLAENIREVFWMMDPQTGAFLYVSPAFDELWEIPVESVIRDPETWFERVHAEDRERVVELRRRRRAGTVLDCE